MDAAQTQLFVRAVDVLRRDPDYAALNRTPQEWAAMVNNLDGGCLVNAIQIGRDGDLGQQHVEMVVLLDDLETQPRGGLLASLSEGKDNDDRLHQLADNVKTFAGVLSNFSFYGLFKAFGSIAFDELIAKPLAADFQAFTFNHLYYGDPPDLLGFKDQRAKWGSSEQAIAHMIEEADLVNGGSPLSQDWRKTLMYFQNLNDRAELGWDADTVNKQVETYLEQRFLSNEGTSDGKFLGTANFSPWLIPVNTPADAMENTLRDGLHQTKLQLKSYLQSHLGNRCWQAQATPTPTPTPTATPTPPPARDALGNRWTESEGVLSVTEWSGVWIRRGTSNVFDATWTKGSVTVTGVLTITIDGTRVSIQRTGSSNTCSYAGVLAGRTVSGTYGCSNAAGPFPWKATIDG